MSKPSNMTPGAGAALVVAAAALCRKLHEYQDDGLDVPGELLTLEAALEKAGASPKDLR